MSDPQALGSRHMTSALKMFCVLFDLCWYGQWRKRRRGSILGFCSLRKMRTVIAKIAGAKDEWINSLLHQTTNWNLRETTTDPILGSYITTNTSDHTMKCDNTENPDSEKCRDRPSNIFQQLTGQGIFQTIWKCHVLFFNRSRESKKTKTCRYLVVASLQL